MGTARHDFFDQIGEQRYDARLGSARGSLRFDIREGRRREHWRVELERGGITVSRDGGDADCVLVTDAETFDGIVEGRVNATTATLRGLVGMHGDIDLLFYFQRLFPDPVGPVAGVSGGAR